MFKNITKSVAIASALSLGAVGVAYAGPGDAQEKSKPSYSYAPASAGGFGATTLWGYIQADGTHVSGTSGLGLVNSSRLATGRYEVVFKRSVQGNNCAYLPVISAQRDGTIGAGRFISAVERASNNKAIYIETRDETGADVDSEFMVMVSCYR